MHAQRHGAIGVLRPRGVLNASALEAADSALAQLQLIGRLMVVLDLSETVVFDGAALEWLLTLDESCGTLGGGICLANPNELCKEILQLTGVEERVGVFPDLASAMGSFAK